VDAGSRQAPLKVEAARPSEGEVQHEAGRRSRCSSRRRRGDRRYPAGARESSPL